MQAQSVLPPISKNLTLNGYTLNVIARPLRGRLERELNHDGIGHIAVLSGRFLWPRNLWLDAGQFANPNGTVPDIRLGHYFWIEIARIIANSIMPKGRRIPVECAALLVCIISHRSEISRQFKLHTVPIGVEEDVIGIIAGVIIFQRGREAQYAQRAITNHGAPAKANILAPVEAE